MALSNEQLQQLKQRLETRLAELRQIISDALAAAGHDQLVGQVRDSGDEALVELLSGVDMAIAEIDTQELMDIRAALDRMETGQYGRCIDCGGEIAPARLQSQPAASRCIECQEVFESRHRRATPSL
ncbi:hypothetical protein Tel_02215 [Candidatus Tenderia electrophaga]|jgi:DnaK suppressor protein|uniref:Zinc finger DksA/TraR C4-type domain-containing protein n=1 Tax=Candidatus Tenderia electrophaga TaxID=1748243 RepID=A0A0S2TA86_9GAMM|nr:hypothetical protein Tel_02215 [Candidatus Tenderia electrophaga]